MIACISRYRDMSRWVPGGEADFAAVFATVPLGDLLRPRRQRVQPTDFAAHIPITIHFGGEIVRRDRAEPYKGSMFAVLPGDLVYSKIDLRNGAIGLMPAGLAPGVVTSEYPTYIPDAEQVDPRYLALILRSANFKHLLRTAASGTSGRKRVAGDSFEELEVPLPDPTEQARLVDDYEFALTRAAKLDAQADQIETRGIADFEAALGLTPPPDLPKRPLQIARFRNMTRWSHEGTLQSVILASAGKPTDLYPMVALGDVIADLRNGWSPRCYDRPATATEWGVLKVGSVSFGEYDEAQNKALPPKLKPKPELEVSPGDVLISRANVLRLVGACAIVRTTRQQLMLCDKIFRVVFERDSQIDPEFLGEILKTPSVRQQIEASVTGTSPTMKNISKPALLGLTFPLPGGSDGLKTQRRIIRALRNARDRATTKHHQAAKLREGAWTDFLAAIFQ